MIDDFFHLLVSELCPWGRSQVLGEGTGFRGGEKRTRSSGNETHCGKNIQTDRNQNKVSKTAQEKLKPLFPLWNKKYIIAQYINLVVCV